MCLFILLLIFFLYPLIEMFNTSTEAGLIGLLAYIIILGLFYLYARHSDSKKEQEAKEKQEKLDNIKQQKELNFQSKIQSLSSKYSTPNKVIRIDDFLGYYIAVFVEHQVVCINDNEILFGDILSFKIIDNYQIEHGNITGDIKTKTSTTSLVGRSVAGGVIGGVGGAIVGGTTASKDSKVNYTQSNDKLIHDYILVVTLNKFDSSIVKAKIGNNWEIAAEVEQMFNLIMQNKK